MAPPLRITSPSRRLSTRQPNTPRCDDKRVSLDSISAGGADVDAEHGGMGDLRGGESGDDDSGLTGVSPIETCAPDSLYPRKSPSISNLATLTVDIDAAAYHDVVYAWAK